MIYLLYKYETNELSTNNNRLRNLFINGISVEHMIPRGWNVSIANNNEDLISNVNRVINGMD